MLMLMMGVDIEHLASLMNDKVGLVSCMYVNIMGQIQPIDEIVGHIKDYPKAHLR